MADSKLITRNLSDVIARRTKPGITLWNRLEGRPRTENFNRALRAEIRDPLWMLTRQWQMGEFRGDDAGSPFFAKAHVETRRMQKYQPASGPVQQIETDRPLEPHAERLALRFEHGSAGASIPVSLNLRLAMGRYWLKLVEPLAAAAVPQFVGKYGVDAPDPGQDKDAPITAHPDAWSSFALAAGRLMDGYKLLAYLQEVPTNRASDGVAALAGLETEADELAALFLNWTQRWILQPAGDSAWLPDRLEYQFAVSVPHGAAEKVLAAEQYHHGRLDWYNFDVDPDRSALGDTEPQAAVEHTLTMIPTNVVFNGMPHTRWWKFEDSVTNFGDIKPDTTDLGKLMLIEFGLVYANDWFVIPLTLPTGSIADLRGLAVTNVFGERRWVEAAGRGVDDDPSRWAMFLLATQGKGDVPADLSLVIPPIAHQVTQSRPVEEVHYARDEMANMVWAIEKALTLPNGDAAIGSDAATATRTWFEGRAGVGPETEPDFVATIRYKVMSSVAENWIPMVSAHVEGDNRATQLQRAAMPRILKGAAIPKPIEPRTALLRPGLDASPKQPYFLHEEEVPRSGVQVITSFQRTRTRTGEVLLWLGARKQTGRGEGSSGLAFDRIVPRTGNDGT